MSLFDPPRRPSPFDFPPPPRHVPTFGKADPDEPRVAVRFTEAYESQTFVGPSDGPYARERVWCRPEAGDELLLAKSEAFYCVANDVAEFVGETPADFIESTHRIPEPTRPPDPPRIIPGFNGDRRNLHREPQGRVRFTARYDCGAQTYFDGGGPAYLRAEPGDVHALTASEAAHVVRAGGGVYVDPPASAPSDDPAGVTAAPAAEESSKP